MLKTNGVKIVLIIELSKFIMIMIRYNENSDLDKQSLISQGLLPLSLSARVVNSLR
jgi:hypothetical protein